MYVALTLGIIVAFLWASAAALGMIHSTPKYCSDVRLNLNTGGIKNTPKRHSLKSTTTPECASSDYGCCADGVNNASSANDSCKNIEIPDCSSRNDYFSLVFYPGIVFLLYILAEHVYKAGYKTGWNGPAPCDDHSVILFFRSLRSSQFMQFILIMLLPILVVSIFASLWALFLFAAFCGLIAVHRTPLFSGILGKWVPPESCLG